MEQKLQKILSLFNGKDDYKSSDYISYSILRKSKGGFSIYLVYAHDKHPVKSNSLLFDTVDNLIKVVEALEYGLLKKAGNVSTEDLESLLSEW